MEIQFTAPSVVLVNAIVFGVPLTVLPFLQTLNEVPPKQVATQEPDYVVNERVGTHCRITGRVNCPYALLRKVVEARPNELELAFCPFPRLGETAVWEVSGAHASHGKLFRWRPLSNYRGAVCS